MALLVCYAFLFMRWWQSVASGLDDALAANEAVDLSQSELIALVQAAVSTLSDVVDELRAQREMERSRDSQVSGLTITPGATDISQASPSARHR